MQTSAFCSVYRHFTCAYLWLAVDTLRNVAMYRHFVVCISIWDSNGESLENSQHTPKLFYFFSGPSNVNPHLIGMHLSCTFYCTRQIQTSAFCSVYRHRCAYIWRAVGIECMGNIRTYPCIHSDADVFSISFRELHGDIFLPNHFRPTVFFSSLLD